MFADTYTSKVTSQENVPAMCARLAEAGQLIKPEDLYCAERNCNSGVVVNLHLECGHTVLLCNDHMHAKCGLIYRGTRQ